jgi:hypothetical protein
MTGSGRGSDLPDLDLGRKRGLALGRVVFGIPSEARDKVLPLLDKGAELMRQVA